jgi:hypothetical protein
MRTIKKLEFGQTERNERLGKKRAEILSRMEATQKARRDAELLRRAERVINHSLESMEEDSAEESESEVEHPRGPLSKGFTLPQLPPLENAERSTISPLSNRRKNRSSVIGACSTPKNTLLPSLLGGKRVTSVSKWDDARGKENSDDSSFSFLSDWSKDKDKRKYDSMVKK